jgi:hypothetical protein
MRVSPVENKEGLSQREALRLAEWMAVTQARRISKHKKPKASSGFGRRGERFAPTHNKSTIVPKITCR